MLHLISGKNLMLPLVERSHRCEMLYTSPPFWTQRRKRSDAGALFCRHAVVNAKGHWVGISELHPKSAHDVFMPVEYPKQWVLDCSRFWNEQYLLQTFLSFNAAFEVLWAGHWMHINHPDLLMKAFPSYRAGVWPGSFWFRRRAVHTC